MEVAGPRGKSAFAKQLGLSPSTYEYYESSRVPSADILIRIADITGVDIRWLLRGEVIEGGSILESHPAIQRAGAMLAKHPDAAGALSAFVDLLAESLKFPQKDSPATAPEQIDTDTADSTDADAGIRLSVLNRGQLVPILGRSAAGVPHFWKSGDQAQSVTELAELIDRHVERESRQVCFGQAVGEEMPPEAAVEIVSLASPDEQGQCEYISAGQIKSKYPDAFAVRIDGESMAPDIRHGDLVLVSPSSLAVDGQPAVIQLANQIGVTCKLCRIEADTVHLIPVNEAFAPQTFSADKLQWALRVLARVRPQSKQGE